MYDSSAGAISPFERDLREIRENRSITLEQVQKRTRIPLDVLERFESGHLIRDPQFNEVYLKALIRSYAESIDLPAVDVLQSYELLKKGTYRGNLRVHLGEELPPEPEPEPEVTEMPDDDPGDSPPAVAALRKPIRMDESQTPRVEKKSPKKKRSGGGFARPNVLDKSWAMIIGATIICIVLIGGLLWLLLREEPIILEETEQQASAETIEFGDPVEEPTVSAAPQLNLPITVTMTAVDGSLQGFRVTEVPDVRRPYWIEPDSSMTFSSDSLIVFWGTGTEDFYRIPDGVELEIQGYRWQPRPGSVERINRARAQALLDSLHSRG